MKIKQLGAISALLLGGSSAWATPINIVNNGFEDPYIGSNLPAEFNNIVPATAFPSGPAPAGWSTFGAVGGEAFVGVLNPGVQSALLPEATNFPAGAPEGNNVALLFFGNSSGGAEFGIQQTLGDTLQLNTTYTLNVEVGNIATGTSVVQPYQSFGEFQLDGFPGYRIDLLAGGESIVQDNNTLRPGEGLFETSTIEVTIGASHAQAGQDLAILLVNLNQLDQLDPNFNPMDDLEVDFDNIRLDAMSAVVPIPGAFMMFLGGLMSLALKIPKRS